MFIEELEQSERSFEEFQLQKVNFDLFYIESPDLLVSLVEALLADAYIETPSPQYPCLTYDCVTDLTQTLSSKSKLSVEAELLWFDNYSRIQSAMRDYAFFSIPRCMPMQYPRVTFASRNKALMFGIPQLEDVDHTTTHSPAKDLDDSWVSVPSTGHCHDVSGWQVVA